MCMKKNLMSLNERQVLLIITYEAVRAKGKRPTKQIKSVVKEDLQQKVKAEAIN